MADAVRAKAAQVPTASVIAPREHERERDHREWPSLPASMREEVPARILGHLRGMPLARSRKVRMAAPASGWRARSSVLAPLARWNRMTARSNSTSPRRSSRALEFRAAARIQNGLGVRGGEGQQGAGLCSGKQTLCQLSYSRSAGAHLISGVGQARLVDQSCVKSRCSSIVPWSLTDTTTNELGPAKS
jgi:hypothetical protein